MTGRKSFQLFRQEVIDANTTRKYGEISISTPPSTRVVVLASLSIVFLTCALLRFGQYTRRESIFGVVEPTSGLLKVYAPDAGKIRRTLVKVGDPVHRGDILMTFSSERHGADGAPVQRELETQMTERLQLMAQELRNSDALANVESKSLQQTISADGSKLAMLTQQISLLRTRADHANAILQKYRDLTNSGFFSEIQYEAKADEVADQQLRLSELEKERATLQLEIERQVAESSAAPLKQKLAVAEISRTISNAQSDLVKVRQETEWSVVSPDDGIVSSIAASDNQAVDPNSAVLVITPAHRELQIRSFAPSRSVGQLKVGQHVKLKFDAFPYQRFGSFVGTIKQIAGAPVLLKELPQGARVGDARLDNPEEGPTLYPIIISISSEDLVSHSQKITLQPGFQLAAEVELETRRIYEWIFEPLNSLQ